MCPQKPCPPALGTCRYPCNYTYRNPNVIPLTVFGGRGALIFGRILALVCMGPVFVGLIFGILRYLVWMPMLAFLIFCSIVFRTPLQWAFHQQNKQKAQCIESRYDVSSNIYTPTELHSYNLREYYTIETRE